MQSYKALYFQLKDISFLLKRNFQYHLYKYGIYTTPDQWEIIETIYLNELPTLSGLANATHRDNASITRSIQLLMKEELVIKSESIDDKRKTVLFLTEKGTDFYLKNQTLVNEIYQNLIEGFTRFELENLDDMLIKLKKNLEN